MGKGKLQLLATCPVSSNTWSITWNIQYLDVWIQGH